MTANRFLQAFEDAVAIAGGILLLTAAIVAAITL